MGTLSRLPANTFGNAFMPGPHLLGRRLPNGLMLEGAPSAPISASGSVEEFPLQVTNASTSIGDPAPVWTAKLQVRYGFVAGKPADAGMSPGDDPIFTVHITSQESKYLYAKFPVEWDNTWGFWKRTEDDGELKAFDALQEASATFGFVALASFSVDVVDGEDGSGLRIGAITQVVSGSQAWARMPAPTIYVDEFTRQ